MTVAPPRPLLHAYSGEDPMEIIDYHGRKLERWRALAEETGRLSALVELSKQVRNDSVAIVARHDERERELKARADAISARERKVAVDAAVVTDLMGRVGKAIDWLERKKANEQEEPLASPPGDPSDPSKPPEPTLELEGDNIAGDPDVPVTAEDQPEFPSGELPPPPTQPPVAAGLDDGD
jgi:hypothetical protein